MTLIDVPDADLEAELARRKAAKPTSPKPLSPIDWAPLVTMAKSYVAWCATDDYHEDNDYPRYLYESAISCIFGEAFWAWKRQVHR